MKKLLSVLLACALAFALLIPAIAAPVGMPNPDYIPNITQQPAKCLFVAFGNDIKLEVQAELPKESDGSPLRYQWSQWGAIDTEPADFLAIDGAQSAALTLPAAGLLMHNAATLYFRCEITAKLKDGETALVKSGVCRVFVYYGLGSALNELKEAWNSAQATHGFFVASVHVASRFFSLAVTPVYFVMDWLRYQFGLRKSF